MTAPARRRAPSVLVFRTGSLGDTLVALPALRAVREHFPGSRLTILCDYHRGKKYVLASEVLRGSGLCDDVILYPVDSSRLGRRLRPLTMLRLLVRLRVRRFETLVYLPNSARPVQIDRERRFFALAGIRRFIGMDAPGTLPASTSPGAGASTAHEADLLLARLDSSGVPVPAPGTGRMDLQLGAEGDREVDAWLASVPPDGNRKWLSVGPGSKQPASRWPIDRYRDVVAALIERFDLWPVVFGGPEDRSAGEDLIRAWGRGYNAAGQLGLRATMAAMKRCRLHVGNDTGTIHMAVAAGLVCVGVYSSHDPHGLWHPYGSGHRVLRTRIDCEGCRLMECVDRRMECILSITTRAVVEACREALEE